MIAAFDGRHGFLSNFFPSPIDWDGLLYPTVENAFQAAKTLDQERRRAFTDIAPSEAKQLGGLVPLRPDWDQVKLAVMLDLVRRKFEIPALARRLAATGDERLVNGNVWGDRFWGVCKGDGKNELGKILMVVRKEIGGGGIGMVHEHGAVMH